MAENKGILPSSTFNTLGNNSNKWEAVYANKYYDGEGNEVTKTELASEEEALLGENDEKYMSPLKVKQAIDSSGFVKQGEVTDIIVSSLQFSGKKKVFTTVGESSFTVPDNVFRLYITARAGGGGGGARELKKNTTGRSGGNGGTTSIGSLLSLSGGTGGRGAGQSYSGSNGSSPSPKISDFGVHSDYSGYGVGGKGGHGDGIYGGNGGNGAGVYRDIYTVKPGDVLPIVVGAGGAGGTAIYSGGSNGSAGTQGFVIFEW